MKILVTIILVLLIRPAPAQWKDVNFNAIDRRALSVDADDPAELAALLTAGCKKDIEKVRAIFRWITENIAYKVPAKKRRANNTESIAEEEDDTAALKPLDERVAEKILRTRAAFCDGYARLFKALCDHAGIRCEVIIGYGRGGIGQNKFRANHSWNAVYADGSWYLLDATWASGFISLSAGGFVKHYDDYYFLTKPEEFIKDHYPDELQWSLLADPPVVREFSRSPFQNKSFTKYAIVGYYPEKGIIDAAVGDTILIELKRSSGGNDRKIAPDFNYDSTFLYTKNDWALVNPVAEWKDRKIIYSYPVASGDVEWLHVMYNNDVILRYKLNIKKDKAVSPLK